MDSSSKIPSLIKKTMLKATEIVAESYQGIMLDNLNIAVDKENGIVSFFDPEENNIASIVIDEWMNRPNLNDNIIVPILKSVIKEVENSGGFDSLELYKPFAINYTDENMFVIKEIATIGDEEGLSDNNLLEKFDRDFDAFLDKLLKE